MLVSAAPQRTVKPVPPVTVFIAGGVDIVPPAVFKLIITSDVASSFVFEMVIVPAAVQANVPLRAVAKFRLAAYIADEAVKDPKYVAVMPELPKPPGIK